jgi:hypothetical protein
MDPLVKGLAALFDDKVPLVRVMSLDSAGTGVFDSGRTSMAEI